MLVSVLTAKDLLHLEDQQLCSVRDTTFELGFEILHYQIQVQTILGFDNVGQMLLATGYMEWNLR